MRLPIEFDPSPLRTEIQATGIEWMSSQWKWHLETRFCILRAGADKAYPGDGLVSGAGPDRPVLDRLPQLRRVLDTLLPVPARLAWLGLSPPGARIFWHRDNTHHWDEHHRLHLPLVTNPEARLGIDGRFVHMPAGSVWALNNSRPHGAHNPGSERIHLMVDIAPTPAVEALLASGMATSGTLAPTRSAALAQDPLKSLHAGHRADIDLISRLLMQ